MPPALPTEAREGCSGLVCGRARGLGAHAPRQLDHSMVESMADDHLTLDGDANVVVGAVYFIPRVCCLYLPERRTDHRIVDGGTHTIH